MLPVQNAINDSNSGRIGPNNDVLTSRNRKSVPNLQNVDPNLEGLASRAPRNTSDSRTSNLNNASQNTPPANLDTMGVNADKNLSEVSPEISKSVSHKRFKFSPGMVNVRQFFCLNFPGKPIVVAFSVNEFFFFF